MRILIVLAVLCFAPATAGHTQDASKTVAISWEALAPQGKLFNDPFSKLSPEQLQDVGYAMRVARLIAEQKLTTDGSDAARAARISRDLKQQGVDIGWLIVQRARVRQLREQQLEAYAKSVSKKFQGQQIKLAGFAIPIKADAKLVTEFLLVPSIDFCNASAPPPSTQVVYVKSSTGVVINNRTTPLTVTGKLILCATQIWPGEVVNYEAEYAIEPTSVKVVDWQGTSK